MKKNEKFSEQEFQKFIKKEIIDAGVRAMSVRFNDKERYLFTYISPVNFNQEIHNRIIYEKLKNPALDNKKIIQAALEHFKLKPGLFI